VISCCPPKFDVVAFITNVETGRQGDQSWVVPENSR
jgi:uncharacterized lipoprotein